MTQEIPMIPCELLIGLSICILVQTVTWLLHMKIKNTELVDIAWTLLMVVCPVWYFFSVENVYQHKYLLLIAPVAWYLRLLFYLCKRFDVKKEDGRYKAMRVAFSNGSVKTGLQEKQWLYSLFFMGQALIAWGFSSIAWLLVQIPQSLSVLDYTGLALVAIALLGVYQSDNQLYRFKCDPKNKRKVCKRGWWRYSRHPNYFFEWLHWLAYPLMLYGTDYFLLSLLYPFFMLLFLLKLTGIPFSETQSIKSRGEQYLQYQKETNKFFIGKPKKVNHD